MTPEQLTKALADVTRLRILALLADGRELCVCELTEVLLLPQPKISRHLGILRETGLLQDRRDGPWIHYRLHSGLPAWAGDVIAALMTGCKTSQPYAADLQRLNQADPACC